MNNRMLRSAVAVHAGACLIALLAVAAGVPLSGGVAESRASSSELEAVPARATPAESRDSAPMPVRHSQE